MGWRELHCSLNKSTKWHVLYWAVFLPKIRHQVREIKCFPLEIEIEIMRGRKKVMARTVTKAWLKKKMEVSNHVKDSSRQNSDH